MEITLAHHVVTLRKSGFPVLCADSATRPFPGLPLGFVEGVCCLAQPTLFICYWNGVWEVRIAALAPVGSQMHVAGSWWPITGSSHHALSCPWDFHARVSSGSFFIRWFITVTVDQMINILCLSSLVGMSSSQVPVVGWILREDNKQVNALVFKSYT